MESVPLDLDYAPTDKELLKCAKPIALVWQAVGIELGLKQDDVAIIEDDYANRSCVRASKAMLFKWRKIDPHPSYKKLKQVMKKCTTATSGSPCN